MVWELTVQSCHSERTSRQHSREALPSRRHSPGREPHSPLHWGRASIRSASDPSQGTFCGGGHSLGPFWTTLMPREFILNLRLDIGPFECSSGCSNLHPDSPPLRVPGIKRDRIGAHSSFHSRRYTASASPTCASYSRLAIAQASILILSHSVWLSVTTYSCSRCQTFVTSLPMSIRDSVADTSRFTGPFLENRCVVNVPFIRCKDSTGKSFLPISLLSVAGGAAVGGIPAEAVCSAFGSNRLGQSWGQGRMARLRHRPSDFWSFPCSGS